MIYCKEIHNDVIIFDLMQNNSIIELNLKYLFQKMKKCFKSLSKKCKNLKNLTKSPINILNNNNSTMKFTSMNQNNFFNLKKFYREKDSKRFVNNCKNFNNIQERDSTTNNKQDINNDSIVTPWEVKGKVDYLKLVNKFGTELITEDLIQRFEKITNKPIHPWIKRNIFFTHRGLNTILTALENNEKIFLYTGRGPSSNSMHLGHLIPFIFTKWLQETFNCNLVIQISDEEKFAFKRKDFDTIYQLGKENAKDIAAIGFNPHKTFIFSNRDYRLKCESYELLSFYLKVNTNANDIKKIFGFNDDSSIAMFDWPFYQTAASFYQSYPKIFGGQRAYCLIPHAIDQDPYFRLARDLSLRLDNYKLIKPCNIMSKFVPPLSGESGKMSSSTGRESTIFLSDTPEIIREKVFKYTYSGGGGNGSLQDHKLYGGSPDRDMAFQYLRYFEYDDEILEKIKTGFSKGEISCSEMKEILTEKLINLINDIQLKRKNIDDNYMKLFYDDGNKIKYFDEDNNRNSINMQKLSDKQNFLIEYLKKLEINYEIKYHENLSVKENFSDIKNLISGNICKTLFLKGPGINYYFLITDFDEIIDLKSLKEKLKLKSLKFGENDTITHLFDIKKSEFGFLSTIKTNKIQDQVFSVLLTEKVVKSQYLTFPFISEYSHITIKNEDFLKIIKNNSLNLICV